MPKKGNKVQKAPQQFFEYYDESSDQSKRDIQPSKRGNFEKILTTDQSAILDQGPNTSSLQLI